MIKEKKLMYMAKKKTMKYWQHRNIFKMPENTKTLKELQTHH